MTGCLANIDAVIVVSGMTNDPLVLFKEGVHSWPRKRDPPAQFACIVRQIGVLPCSTWRALLPDSNGIGLTSAPAGSLQNIYLVVTDIQAARNRLLELGVKIGEIRHKTPIGAWDGGFASGIDTGRGDYASFAEFCDPDGNSWVLQERGYRKA